MATVPNKMKIKKVDAQINIENGNFVCRDKLDNRNLEILKFIEKQNIKD